MVGLLKNDIGMKMSYGDISDARILYSAFEQDGILVTSNIKDFLLYPLLFLNNHEKKLYNLLSNSYIHFSRTTFKQIYSDKEFKIMLNKLIDLGNREA